MGTVYRAEHRVLHHTVALKVIAPGRLGDPDNVERFYREAELAVKLDHPNVIAVLDAECVGTTHMMVQEFVEGSNLADWLVQRGPLPAAEACAYALQTALGLQHAHEHGLVHRDIKPQNLLRTSSGHIKIADFGLARLVSEGAVEGLTAENQLLGSADYIAPEQIRSAHSCDIRADLYSLGCTLYTLLAGRPPFAGLGLMEKLRAHEKRPPPPLSKVRPDLDPKLVRLVDRLMSKDPTRRFEAPCEAAGALAPFAVGCPPQPGDVPPAAASVGPGQGRDLDANFTLTAEKGRLFRRRRPLVAAVLVLGLLGAGTAGTAVYHFVTDRGELVITTTDPRVEVVVTRNGREIIVIDPKTRTRVSLRPGVYVLKPGSREHEVVIWPEQLTIERGGVVVAKVEPAVTKDRPQHGSMEPPRVEAAPSPPTSWDGHTLAGQGFSTAAAILPNGRYALTVGDRPKVMLWDLTTGREVGRYDDHPDVVWSLAVRPDGRLAATGGQDKVSEADFAIRLRDLPSGATKRLFVGHTSIIAGLAFTPDGTRLFSTSYDRTVRAWDVTSGSELWRQPEPGFPLGLAASPDGRRVAVGTFEGTITLRDVATGAAVQTLPPLTGPADSLAFLPGGRGLVSVPSEGEHDAGLVWSLDTGRVVWPLRGHRGPLAWVVVSPDGRLAATGGHDRTARLWNLATGQEVHRFDGFTGRVRALAFAPDGHTLLAGGDDGSLRLWPVPKFTEPPAEVRVSTAPGAVVVPVPSPRPGQLAEVARFRLLKPEGHAEAVFSADSRRVVFSTNASNWDDPVGGTLVCHPSVWVAGFGPEPELTEIALPVGPWVSSDLAPDARHLLTADLDGTVRWHDLETRRARELAGVGAPFQKAGITPDNRLAVLAVMDRVVALDLTSGKVIHDLRSPGGRITWVAVTPDGRRGVGRAERRQRPRLGPGPWGAVAHAPARLRHRAPPGRVPRRNPRGLVVLGSHRAPLGH